MVVARPTIIVFGVIALMFWLAVYPPLANKLVPCQIWMCVKDVRVNSVRDGGTPTVIISREVYRDFVGDRVVKLISLSGADANRTCKRVREGREYLAGEAFPVDPVPLTDFQGVPPEAACVMHDGSYQVEMSWTTRFWWLPGVAVTQVALSNIFQVAGIDTPDPDDDGPRR